MKPILVAHPKGLSPFNSAFTTIDRAGGRVGPRLRKKLCIIGACMGEEDVPRDTVDYEIWGCNSLWGQARDSQGRFRADRWFELHPRSVQSVSDLDYIQQCPIPLYTLWDGDTSWAPSYVRYPLHDVYGDQLPRYFTNTFAYQMALAIHEGFSEIRIANVWLQGGRELCVERACLEFWIGVAIGKGVKMDIPVGGTLLTHPFLYGYDYHQEKEWVEKMLQKVLPSIASDGYAGSR